MWEPQHSFWRLGFETGYYRIYSVKSTNPKGDVTNSAIPLMFVASMKFSKKIYVNWSMGQSLNYNKISNTDSAYNFNSSYLLHCRFFCYIRIQVYTKTNDFLYRGNKRLLCLQVRERNHCTALHCRIQVIMVNCQLLIVNFCHWQNLSLT